MTDLGESIGTRVAFAVGDGASSGTRKAGMVEEDDTTASHAMGRGEGGGASEQRAQLVQVDVAMTQGVVECGPMTLHGEAEFDRTVWAGRLGHRVDKVEQRSGALGEGLIYFLAELRQTVECFHTRKSARSSVLSQGPLL